MSKRIKESLKETVQKLKNEGIMPRLAVIIVEGDPASRVYVDGKKRDCEEIGIYSEEYALPRETSEEQILEIIEVLNGREDVNGILVQLPLPEHINEEKVIYAIDPAKDVDAFHPVNVGKIMIGNYDFVPCTPGGVMELIRESGISIEGRDCVVVGRSNIVGKPQAMMLLHSNATVTVCHSKTHDLASKTKNADILVAAVGRANFITADMVKEGAVVIDVGMNRADGKLCGDVDFEGVSKVAGFITPVPGGVGLMTRAMLMKNTVRACKIQKNA